MQEYRLVESCHVHDVFWCLLSCVFALGIVLMYVFFMSLSPHNSKWKVWNSKLHVNLDSFCSIDIIFKAIIWMALKMIFLSFIIVKAGIVYAFGSIYPCSGYLFPDNFIENWVLWGAQVPHWVVWYAHWSIKRLFERVYVNNLWHLHKLFSTYFYELSRLMKTTYITYMKTIWLHFIFC